MKKYKLFLGIIFLGAESFSQPFQIGHTTLTLIDSSRNNRNIPTEIYYPADVSGNNVPVTTSSNDKFPLLSFGHGFVMDWDAYQNIWEAVVPEGFIIAFPKSETGLAPSHDEFAHDLSFVISELNEIGLDSTSLFFNRVDTMNCVMGHSMGGGAAFLAAQSDPGIKLLATLAPAETNPSAIQAAASMEIPSLIIAGGNDCVTPPVSNQIIMYDSLQSLCKILISINGGSHCQMANYNFLCSFGEATCSPQPAITRMEQHAVINRYLLPWLKYELKNDCSSGAQFDSLIATDTSILFQKNCLLCNTVRIQEETTGLSFEVSPNPFDGKLYIQGNQQVNGTLIIELYLTNGMRIFSQEFSGVKSNEKLMLNMTEGLQSGIYLLKLSVNGQHWIRKVLKN